MLLQAASITADIIHSISLLEITSLNMLTAVTAMQEFILAFVFFQDGDTVINEKLSHRESFSYWLMTLSS